MTIHLLPILRDNYVFIIEGANNECLVIDPGLGAPVLDFLDERGLRLTHILNTHHHWDHTDGNLEIKAATGCRIVGPSYEAIPGLDEGLSEGEVFEWQDLRFEVLHTPGHTAGHITYYCPALASVFVGDVLFAMGCGRLFEGSAEDAWGGFQKILALPDETAMYCAHEYTLNNAQSAMKKEPENEALAERYIHVKDKRRKGLPTIPSSIGLEKQTNPFIRFNNAEEFAAFRALRDKA